MVKHSKNPNAKHFNSKVKKKAEKYAARYMTRNVALTHLQLKLPAFRQLCILKGIHPREPPKKFAGHNKTYYHVKDIKFLAHEPLLETSREDKVFDRKIKKAKSKKNEKLAQRFHDLRPIRRLDHLVKERYPSFVDALRDMDDPLTLLHLFAKLPADKVHKIPTERVLSAQRLTSEWQNFIMRTNSLRKIFVSVKGIYHQANVHGQDITWLCPHLLSQILPDDVDYRVMLTFVEFYETLVGFVNYKLYYSLGWRYPPLLKPELEQEPSGLEQVVDTVKELGEDEEDTVTTVCKTLFKDLRIFLAQEVPRDSLLFVIRSFGGSVSWDGQGAPFEESDEEITHQIVDRPTQGRKFLSREYVQPQWVYDSANARKLLPTDAYLHGRFLPPHMSPFVDSNNEVYIPQHGIDPKLLETYRPPELFKKPEVEFRPVEKHAMAEAMDRELHQEHARARENTHAEQLLQEMEGVPYSASLNKLKQDDVHGNGNSPAGGQKAVEVHADDFDKEVIAAMMPRKARKLYKTIKEKEAMQKAVVDQVLQRKKKARSKTVG